MPVQLFLLGPFQYGGPKPSEPLPAKAIALVGLLAASTSPVLRERVLDLLWPSSAPDAARKNLRNVLWSVRKHLGDETVTGEEDRLALGQVRTDLDEFNQAVMALGAANRDPATLLSRLEKATALYRGPFLQDLVVEESPDFEIWLDGEREQLAQANLRMLAALVESYQAKREWNQVIAAATQALRVDDLQEPMYRAQMQAHAILGQRAEALRQYDAAKNVLQRELGVEPLAETTELRAAILAGAYDQPAIVQARPVPARRTRSVVPSAVEPSPFVGREREMERLESEWKTARAGQARIVILSGELGIGKSRLWREWSRSLDAATVVLQARCLESTLSLPLAPITELLRTHPILRPLFQQNSPLSPVWLSELKRLVPEVFPPSFAVLPLTGLPPDEERRRLFEALTQVLLSIDRPRILFVDDIQWADTTTLDWLDYAIHRMAGERFFLVAATRPEEALGALVLLLARWGREGLAQRIEVDRLSRDEGETLASALGLEAASRLGVFEKSAGNPYFMIELIRAHPDQVPPGLADLVKARLQRLPDTAQQVLQAGAILDPDFDVETLRRTSGRGEEETLDALDHLLSAGVLEEREGTYVFSHPLVGHVLREGLSGARCVFLHRRAAQALEQTLATGRRSVASRIATHWAESGDRVQAAHFTDLAAEYALDVASPIEAVGFRRQALALHPTPERHFKLAETLFRLGELAEARREFETALGEFDRMGDRINAGQAAIRVAETLFPSGQFEEGYRWIERGVQYLGEDSDPASHTMVHFLRGSAEIERGHPDLAELQFREGARHAEEHQLFGIGGRVYFLLGNALAEQGQLGPALEAYRASLRMAERSGDELQQTLTLNNLAYHTLLVGDRVSAHAYVERGIALAEQRMLRVPLQNLFSTQGEIALAEQQWTTAETWFQRGLVEAERNSNRREIANARANLGRVLRGRGDLDAALGALESARPEAQVAGDHHLQIKVNLLLAELYLQRGERTAAHEAIKRAQTSLESSPRRLYAEWAEHLERQLLV